MAVNPKKSGFTLVELAIVLVIIGLLVGAILAGQTLIHAAELRSIGNQYESYITAVNTFKDKYLGLPGDITNATSYWGAADGADGTTSACAMANSGTQATCNGNGDGKIAWSTSSYEMYRFWQQLANAGLIEGNFNGITMVSGGTGSTPDNSPQGKIATSLWFVFNFGTLSGQDYSFDGKYDNVLQFGGMVANADPQGPLLSPEDIYSLDVKLDDGKPATGTMVVRLFDGTYSFSDCTTATDSSTLTADYLLTNPAKLCAITFRQLF